MPSSRLSAAFISAVLGAAAAAHAQTAPATSPAAPPSAAPIAIQTIDIMNKVWGRHPATRANHAKGTVVEGTFTPTPAAIAVSKATIFAGPTIPVTVRFSDSTGLPTLADGAAPANPHGMAIRFRPPQGAQVDVVVNSLGFFPVATGEEFLQLLTAVSESGPDAPKPTKLDQFIATHPSVPAAFGSTSTPTSFARETYNGVDAFVFVNAAGTRQPFRFKFEPVAGAEHISPEAAAKLDPNFLQDEITNRLATEKVSFRVLAQLAEPGDVTKDPTKPWPADRKLADLGVITLDHAAPDQAQAAKDLRFLPTSLEPGIEPSDDPLIDARVRAYVISFGRRG